VISPFVAGSNPAPSTRSRVYFSEILEFLFKTVVPRLFRRREFYTLEKRDFNSSAKFPVDGRINDYGFLHFKVGLLSALGWKKGMPLKISKNSDGSITVRKA